MELVVSDDAGALYSSGALTDNAHPETGEDEADGFLHDEDLDEGVFYEDNKWGVPIREPGGDANQRPEANLGLVSFRNHFIYVDVDGEWHETETPITANHMDNTHSLDMLVPRTYNYDVVFGRPVKGEVLVSARLRYRSFPPHFLRKLAVFAPDLVTEEMIDANVIVDMAEDALVVDIK